MSQRAAREMIVARCRGCSANRMPLSIARQGVYEEHLPRPVRDCMDLTAYGLEHVLQQRADTTPVGRLDALGHRDLA